MCSSQFGLAFKFDMKTYLRIWSILSLIAFALPFKTNITQFGNCNGVLHEGEVYPVEITEVQYENEGGFVNTMHGNYVVRSVDTREKELLITIFHCPQTTTTGQCNSNGKTFIESLHCDQFKRDNSGIWYMISSAMSGSHCGETTGTFDMQAVTLRTEYLTKYITEDPPKGRYLLQMLFHKKSATTDDVDVRGCVSVEFDIL
ncbi:unnamed protein product [Hermetia illucens]|uniref:Uncharacterized protein n=1 Tax=Hermetia illucens TaxID=343691 RepID=A0A7R8UFC4_HERIL|nr:uncharacterized protein LOC119661670 [Hermetia illucens]CAD7079557.1 unnamed protein product [Hermetia illucens]